MMKLDRNLDAYRTCVEAIVRLRRFLRQQLNGGEPVGNGADWVPDDLRSHLSQRQSREHGIHWGIGESSDLLDYAGFANIFEIIATSDPMLQVFSILAPDSQLLRSRFLEMDTIFNRVAFARPVSDNDLEFLAGFDDRLRRLVANPDLNVRATLSVVVEPPPVPVKPPELEPKPSAEKKSKSGEPDEKVPPRSTSAHPSPKNSEKSAPPPPTPPPSMPEMPRKDIEQLLVEDDTQGILTALYNEITVMADGLWGSGTPPVPRIWERVRESDWYRAGFVPLNLKPVSDFYDVAESGRERLLAGSSRNQVQDYLREHNFAQLLLSLRDLFRKHLPGGEGAGQSQAGGGHPN